MLSAVDFIGLVWRPTIGDPDLLGWVTTIAYAIATFYCARAWFKERGVPGMKPWFWFACTLLMAALGLNKQLDIQMLGYEIFRALMRRLPLEEYRYTIEKGIVVLLGLGAMTLTAIVVWYMWPIKKRYSLAIIGMAYLLMFVSIRAAGFIHRMSILNRDHGVMIHVILELGGIVFISLGALRAIRSVSAEK